MNSRAIMTMTGQEIKDLAEFAGMTVDHHGEDDLLETELTVVERPEHPIIDEDDGSKSYYAKAAHFTEYPEEGVMPLGHEIEPPRAVKREAESMK